MKTRAKRTVGETLKLQLEESILAGVYKPGDRLPSERQIMEDLKIGRSTVREAYHSLQQKGLIEIRHGGGAFVRNVDSSMVGDTLATLIRHRRVSTRHLQEFREAVESRCAAYAAERATKDQVDDLKRLLNEMEAHYQTVGKADLEFYDLELNLHTQLAIISGNPMFEWFAITFQNNASSFANILTDEPVSIAEILDDWHDFITAVQNREVTKAAMIIRTHIFRFGKILEKLDRKKKCGISTE